MIAFGKGNFYRNRPLSAGFFISCGGQSMTKSQLIVQHIPYLRRYARALTGSQNSGDSYVAATLEAMVDDRNLLDGDLPPRIALFRLFSKIWNSVSVNGKSDTILGLLPADRHLENIAALPRQAFLLISVENFSEEDAAGILDVGRTELQSLVEQAGRELASQIATDVLIIEDEALVAMDLESLVQDLGHQVIGVARTHNEAIDISKNGKPGIILADIQLADGSSGLEAVNELLEKFEVPVIFITAYLERFLTGERPEPAFLVSKPYQPSMLSAIISQALFFERNAVQRKKHRKMSATSRLIASQSSLSRE
jgi:CheY-like chemotaxis protein